MTRIRSKKGGYFCDHIKSKCCNSKVIFTTGYSIEVWCEKCGNYIFSGKLESFIALWLGDFEAVIKNKGYTPKWTRTFDLKHMEVENK